MAVFTNPAFIHRAKMSHFLADIVEIVAEIADNVFDKFFSEMIAKKIFAQMPDHEITSVFVSFDSASLLQRAGIRLKKIAEMEHEGYRYLKKERKIIENREVGETIYFIRNLQGIHLPNLIHTAYPTDNNTKERSLIGDLSFFFHLTFSSSSPHTP